MGAGGVVRQTGRNNTVMPYNVGFLNEATDTEKYNVAVYDELQKVSSSSTHMFQALDEIHKEIDVRIAALDAMNLKYDALNNRITTEIATAIASIQQQIGNLDLDDITDNTDPLNPIKLSGTIAGMKTSITSNDTKITTVQGIANQNGAAIGIIQDNIKNKSGDMSQYMQLSEFDAVWGVNSHINGKTAGVSLTNNGVMSQFNVTADKFVVNGTDAQGTPVSNPPFIIQNGRVKMNYADIANVNVTTAQIANAQIDGANIIDASIESAKIKNLTVDAANITGTINHAAASGSGGSWSLNADGSMTFTGAGGERMEMNSRNLTFYNNNIMRIRIGTW